MLLVRKSVPVRYFSAGPQTESTSNQLKQSAHRGTATLFSIYYTQRSGAGVVYPGSIRLSVPEHRLAALPQEGSAVPRKLYALQFAADGRPNVLCSAPRRLGRLTEKFTDPRSTPRGNLHGAIDMLAQDSLAFTGCAGSIGHCCQPSRRRTALPNPSYDARPPARNAYEAIDFVSPLSERTTTAVPLKPFRPSLSCARTELCSPSCVPPSPVSSPIVAPKWRRLLPITWCSRSRGCS